jgi:hypothetical protein
VYVGLEGHARIAELANPVERLKATGQTDLEDVLAPSPFAVLSNSAAKQRWPARSQPGIRRPRAAFYRLP